ncbi:hypothetical protein RM543_11865 [Roseicyclus sp. F158]|uniref:Glycosyltransferase family 1 protein n=1 Tax=Tropicimonas omnivorans TaxID=3075590 RepID=A0ABU3DI61_9RHOB|nr:hypothetical protein [Roseicyclus sp. F158]MDT0683385.1 hypothetical protein [Roseicyclus sp. F158]
MTIFDSVASLSLPFGRLLPEADFYFKKSLYADPSRYAQDRHGGSNLSEFYGARYGLEMDVVPGRDLGADASKLRLSPNFLTEPTLFERFRKGEEPARQGEEARPIDLHARLGGVSRDGWYGRMRQDAEVQVGRIGDISAATGGGLPWAEYMAELGRSKLCFSPFGSGELCWRDVEAILAGAVLLKPSMDHLRTLPDLYRPWETYVPLAWDFSDLGEKVRTLLGAQEMREEIAREAYCTARDFARSTGPVDAYREMLAS